MDRQRNKSSETGQTEPPSMEEFGDLFERTLKEVRPGEIVRGHVVQVSRDYVTVDIGYKSEGHIPVSEFRRPDGTLEINEGDEIDVFFESEDGPIGGIRLSRSRAEKLKVWSEIEQAFNDSVYVQGKVVGRVKGGLKVDIGVPAFLPGSHADIRPSRNLDRYVGETGRFAILKFNRSRGNVVVSRRAVLESERENLKEKTLQVLEEGVILEGQVKNLTDYGAFVDLGGIDGLLHVTDMSWGRVNRPSEVVDVGDRVKVVILKYDPERERVSLGMKQIQPDPWENVDERYLPGMRVQGNVVSLVDYGAFVELEKGIEGLVHVSEMSWTKRVSHPKEVVNEGDEVDVVILDADRRNRRISLGLKQAGDNPWEVVRVNHPVGSRVRGTVKSVTDFGIFLGLEEGVDGLVHVSDLHWTKKVEHPSELYSKGDEVDAVVLSIDVENQRLSLGVKQLTPDPWQQFADRHPVGTKVEGTVSSVADFGAFVELEGGIEGLIHISQLSSERIDRPQDYCTPGDRVSAEVISVDPRERRIGLSIRALRQTEEREEVDAYLRKEQEKSRFSFRDILREELPLDQEGGVPERPSESSEGPAESGPRPSETESSEADSAPTGPEEKSDEGAQGSEDETSEDRERSDSDSPGR